MINLSPQTKAIFLNLGFWEGLKVLCEKEVDDAIKALKNANPNDPLAIKTAQERIQVFEKDLPGVRRQIEDYAAQMAAAARQSAEQKG